MKSNVVTRIAPSPTGTLHIGTARSALFNYLYAKGQGGKFIVRIEDTDKERSTKEYENEILNSLAWLGIEYDDLFRQSERGSVYKKYIDVLIDGGFAYTSKEASKADIVQEVELVRFKNPNTDVAFHDEVRGEVTFNTEELGDFIIARDGHEPLHHLAVVVDDEEMGVTHVIRGEDLLSNTPRQILIQEALGFERPVYAHMPLILAPDKTKLSKRKGNFKTLGEYQTEGFVPEAMVNYLALLGWNPGTEQEIFSVEELAKSFDIEKIQKGGAVFDESRLRWFNGEHLRRKNLVDVRALLEGKNIPTKLLDNDAALADLLERTEVLSDIDVMRADGEFDYYELVPQLDKSKLVWKDSTKDSTFEHLSKLLELLESVKEFTAENVKDAVWGYASEEGRGSVLWPMRFALSGREKSPDPFLLAEVLGKEETFNRLDYAKDLLS